MRRWHVSTSVASRTLYAVEPISQGRDRCPQRLSGGHTLCIDRLVQSGDCWCYAFRIEIVTIAALDAPRIGACTLSEKRIDFRVGINLGDVIAEEDDIFGDVVNIAARLEGLRTGAGFASAGSFGTKYATGWIAPSRTSVSSRSRISHGWCACTGFGRSPSALRRRPPPRRCLSRRRSIAVLLFANISGDPQQEYFADGMVEEIITALSRIRWLFVIARNSNFTYKGQAVDVKHVGRELGVRYVLEGSVRKAGGRVRVAAQLIEATNGAHLSVSRFDGSLEDVFDLQDRVASSVAGVIEPALQAAEIRRSGARPLTELGAYDLYLRALAVFYPIGRERLFEALGFPRAGDHDGSALRTGAFLGRGLPHAAHH